MHRAVATEIDNLRLRTGHGTLRLDPSRAIFSIGDRLQAPKSAKDETFRYARTLRSPSLAWANAVTNAAVVFHTSRTYINAC